MTKRIYTAITFSPVQSFIEKSRKLRDLYGSSTILSYLADEICRAARQHLLPGIENPTADQDPVVSPALIKTAQGTPNQIVIRGHFPDEAAEEALHTALEEAFYSAWTAVVEACRQWIETQITHQLDGSPWDYRPWRRPWREWSNHAWEFFIATGNSLDEARKNLNQVKYARAWTGINWVGESSTLSGLDSRAWPMLGHHAPHSRKKGDENREVQDFYRQLRQELGEATITEREQLSIPELVKRLITIDDINQAIPRFESPASFKALNRQVDAPESESAEADREEPKRWTGWFMGDGDRAGAYLKQLTEQPGSNPDDIVHDFSLRLRNWGKDFYRSLPPASHRQAGRLGKDGRIVYAGGDDFLGVLFRNPPHDQLQARECLEWFYGFPDIWSQHGVAITASVGFVWAAPNVPQRDVLQHCRLAEKSAKKQGRDRLAIRILFNDGKHLEWTCPWRFLPLLTEYRDRNQTIGEDANWTHIYSDIATLQSRHAFRDYQTTVSLAFLQVYFLPPVAESESQPSALNPLWGESDRAGFYDLISASELDVNHPALWNRYDGQDPYDSRGTLISTGLLGEHSHFLKSESLATQKVSKAFNHWVINLAKVGFHLHRDKAEDATILRPAA